jgi:PIN domain nuclease of toxin-antitoxin system
LILLDTHVVIWLAQDYSRISAKARLAIEEARKKSRGVAVCGISLVEIARIVSRGQVRVTPDLETFLSEVERTFVMLQIDRNVALQSSDLPASYPKDPVDRIIGATALIHDIPLVTADREIRKSRAIPTIW